MSAENPTVWFRVLQQSWTTTIRTNTNTAKTPLSHASESASAESAITCPRPIPHRRPTITVVKQKALLSRFGNGGLDPQGTPQSVVSARVGASLLARISASKGSREADSAGSQPLFSPCLITTHYSLPLCPTERSSFLSRRGAVPRTVHCRQAGRGRAGRARWALGEALARE
jgi:hypothetical protein